MTTIVIWTDLHTTSSASSVSHIISTRELFVNVICLSHLFACVSVAFVINNNNRLCLMREDRQEINVLQVRRLFHQKFHFRRKE